MEEQKKLNFSANIEKNLRNFCEEIKQKFGDNLKSIILYGSSVSGDYIQNKSNFNIIVILSEINFHNLRNISKFINQWYKQKIVPPLFLTESYVKTSTDVFPIEFLEMKENYYVLYGEDFFKNLEISLNNLRLECESKLKGNLVRIRQSYLETKNVKKLLEDAFTAFLPVFRGIIRLKNIIPPILKQDVLKVLTTEFDLDKDIFFKLLSFKKGELKFSNKEQENLLEKFLEEIQKLVKIVDEFKIK